jgi:ketosteroid isomerase-like protein
MRTLALAMVVALAGIAGMDACAGTPVAGSHAGPVADDARAAITAVLRRQIDAWNRGDLAGYMDGYARTPALVFTSGGNIRRGWQDAFDHYRARYATDPKAMGTLQLSIDSIDLIGDPVGDGGAVVLGHWDLTATEHAGRGVFSLVLERRPEGWRIIHDHTSSSP